MVNHKLSVALATICMVLCLCEMVSAHQTWLEIDAMCVDLGDTIDVRLTEGHNFIGEGVPPHIVSAELVDPTGSRTMLDKTSEDGLYWHSGFKADHLGLYAILGYHEEVYFTKVYTGPGSRQDYPDYPYMWFEGEVIWDEINKTNWADDWHVVQYAKPYKYSKAFVSTNCNFYGTDMAFNQPLEIIPIDDIPSIGTGNFTFQVLWNGNPLPEGTLLMTGTQDADTKVSAICDGGGMATLPLNSDGNWLISVSAINETVYWDGNYTGEFPHGDNYTSEGGVYIGNTHSAALTILTIRESTTATMRTKIRPGIRFSMTPSYLDFGELDPGDVSDNITIVIQNTGSKDIRITLGVTDTSGLYTQGFYINNILWSGFETTIAKDSHVSLDTRLHVPEGFTGSGEIMGNIICWAEAV